VLRQAFLVHRLQLLLSEEPDRSGTRWEFGKANLLKTRFSFHRMKG
jgi:hypothetical protein